MRKTICKLGRKEAIEAIQNRETVMFKSGVWNKYERQPIGYVEKRIQNSGYGADVTVETDTGEMFVCCPSASDMW